MTRAGCSHNPMKLLSPGLLLLIAVVSATQTFAAGGSIMSLTADEKAQIRRAVEAIDDEEPVGVLKGDEAAQARFWATDLTVNAPNNQIVRHAEILERMKQHTPTR